MNTAGLAPAAPLPAALIGRLRSRINGSIFDPSHADYDAARRVWNGMIDHHPALIVQCGSVADVQAALSFARDEGLPVAVRGGGHNAAGLASCDQGLVIDLSAMNQVEVDPVSRTARAGGGTTWGALDAATQAHGLAVTGGAISTTGVAGLTLGGGLGWLMRKHGLACDNLVEADVVTADGAFLTASAESNTDLFWGLSGGGGNFGVVTAFTFRLHPLTDVLGGLLVHPADRAGELLRYYRDVTSQASDDLTTFAAMVHSPEGAPVSAFVLCHTGDADSAENEVRPIRQFGPPLVDDVSRKPYAAHQSMLDAGYPAGMHVYWKAHFLTGLEDAAIDTLVEHFGAITSPLSSIVIEHLGGAVARVDPDATAFAYRNAPYNLAVITCWTDPAEADRHIAWTRGLFDAMQPFADGVYVNYLGAGDGVDRVMAAYGPAKYARLAEIKGKYDPDNIFSRNQNILPARRTNV